MQSTERRAQGTELGAGELEHRAQSAELRAQSSELGAGSTELRAQSWGAWSWSWEHRAQSAERRAQSSELRAQGTELGAWSWELEPESSSGIGRRRVAHSWGSKKRLRAGRSLGPTNRSIRRRRKRDVGKKHNRVRRGILGRSRCAIRDPKVTTAERRNLPGSDGAQWLIAKGDNSACGSDGRR